MKNKATDKIFYGVVIFLVLVSILLLANYWGGFIPGIQIDKYSVLLFFTIIGLSLLSFANKIKIGNFLEVERLKQKIQKVELNQYLGEIIETPQKDLLYYDSDGKHIIPDVETREFLKTNKGYILITDEVLEEMKPAHPLESVQTAKKVIWGKHVFVILNGKKYWVSVSDFADIGISNGDINGLNSVTDEEIRLYPTGRRW